jgi:hypothetical protein
MTAKQNIAVDVDELRNEIEDDLNDYENSREGRINRKSRFETLAHGSDDGLPRQYYLLHDDAKDVYVRATWTRTIDEDNRWVVENVGNDIELEAVDLDFDEIEQDLFDKGVDVTEEMLDGVAFDYEYTVEEYLRRRLLDDEGPMDMYRSVISDGYDRAMEIHDEDGIEVVTGLYMDAYHDYSGEYAAELKLRWSEHDLQL